jgi:hypothetical protein
MAGIFMRQPLMLLMTGLLAAASIAIALVASSLERPPATETTDSASVLAVYRFYEAVNDMISTGDPTSLHQFVHPDLHDLDASPAGSAGRCAIEGYLTYLHAAVPEMRIEPELVLGDGAEVMAIAAVSHDTSTLPLGFLLDQPSMLWPRHEQFLVSSEQIIARQVDWSEPAKIDRFDAFPTSLDLDPQHPLEVTLTEAAAGTTWSFDTTETPAVLMMDRGNLEITLSKPASDSAFVLDAESPATTQTAERMRPGTPRTIGAGEVVIVPPEASYTVQNQWDDPAVLVTIAVAVPPLDGAESATFALFPQPGMYIRSLLTLQVRQLDTPSHMQFGSVSMPPGSRLAVDPATSLMVVWAESGAIVSATARSGCIESGYASSPQTASERPYLLCPGGDAEQASIVNAGPEPATAWVIAITSVPEIQ